MLILVLLGMYFDAAMVFVTKSSLFFRLAVAILWQYHPSFSGVLCSILFRDIFGDIYRVVDCGG